MSFDRFIRLISNGEPVSANVANRPIEQLDQNVRYLWSLFQSAGIGSAHVMRMQPVESTIQVGQPVYFDSTEGLFKAALAVVEVEPETGYMIFPDRAQVWGVVSYKHKLNSADILLHGFLQVDIRAAVDVVVPVGEPVPAGLWYLDSAGAGRLTRQMPPVSVPVLRTDATGGVYVQSSIHDFFENHRHYVFDLTMAPAGHVTPPAPGAAHAITAADADLPGWLPANHASFAGKAPAGAKFGYNIPADPPLAAAFPPIPLQSVVLVMQRPSVYDATEAPRNYGQELTPDLVRVDRHGIWWMRDCYDEVPWPTDLNTAVPVSASGDIVCDETDRSYSLRLYFARVGAATTNTAVRSLSSSDPRIQVVCDGSDTEASVGDLSLSLNMPFTVRNTNVAGSTALKAFDTELNVFDTGPAVNGVYAATPNVSLHGTSSRVDTDGKTVYFGRVGLGVLDQSLQELSSQLVRLDGVTEENYPVLYLGMPNDSPTSFVVKFEIPSTAPAASTFRYRVRLLGRASGTLPQLTTEYYLSARPSAGLSTPVPVLQNYATLPMTTVAAVTANTAVEATSNAIDVSPGDILYIRVQRNPDAVGDAYAAEVGIMQQVGTLLIE